MPLQTPRLVRRVLAIATTLAAGNIRKAEASVAELDREPALEVTGSDARPTGIAPTLRARAVARVLLDLARGDWQVRLEDGQIFVTAPTWRAGGRGLTPDEVRDEKARLRRSMTAMVREQLMRPATQEFIAAQEQQRYTERGNRSIVNLVADGKSLAQALRERGADAVQPYLELATSEAGTDAFTGLRLADVYRYLRYFWSFPFGSIPGRTLPFLIRDAGQPNHPVCGLLAISSAVPRLSPRDGAFGWTPEWLEAVTHVLSVSRKNAREALRSLDSRLRDQGEGSVSPARIWADAAAALGLQAQTVDDVLQGLQRLSPSEASQRLRRARERLTRDLVAEVEEAVRAIALDDFGLTHDAALRDPVGAVRTLERAATKARAAYLRSRKLGRAGAKFSRASSSLTSPERLTELSLSPLFKKKRASQAAQLLEAWVYLRDLCGGGTWDRFTELVRGEVAAGRGYSGGAHVHRALRLALLQRQSRFLASQVADVTVCGAIPPYGPLLGGKLAALLALSRDTSQLYFETYGDTPSEIASQMAGQKVTRSANLVALTTTGFYGVGTSQYERVRLGNGVRWQFVGYSGGHGTMHFSEPTSEVLLALVKAETGLRLHTSTFGEGPSERLRKIRDGLVRLGLDGSDLLRHGMPRQVFVAELRPGATRPGAAAAGTPWRLRSPSAAEVAEEWRRRWLAPRLVRLPGIIADIERFSREKELLSERLAAVTASEETSA